jgi:hypothetical protein
VPLHTALANDGVPLFFDDDDDDDDDDAEASSSGGREVSRAERSRGNARRLFERLFSRAHRRRSSTTNACLFRVRSEAPPTDAFGALTSFALFSPENR